MFKFVLKLFVAIKLFIAHPLLVFGFCKGNKFLPFEKALLDSLEELLIDEESKILNSQLMEINLVEYSHVPRTIVTFNKIRWFSYDLNRSLKFSKEKSEYKLAKIDFKLNGSLYRAIVYVVFGNIYSIEITADISVDMNSKNIEVVASTLV